MIYKGYTLQVKEFSPLFGKYTCWIKSGSLTVTKTVAGKEEWCLKDAKKWIDRKVKSNE